MRWESAKRLLAVPALLALTANADATLISYGTAEGISFRTCVAGVSGCDDLSPLVQSAFGGFPGAASSSATSTLAGFGTASGTVTLSGVIGAPLLSAIATSTAGTRQNTNSVALQSYTYVGSAPTTITFDGTLTYAETITGVYPFFVGDGVNATIDVFTLSVPAIDVGSTPESNFDALINENLLPGYVSLGASQYTATTSTLNGVANLSVAVTLNPGEVVWVQTLLQTPAANGGIVDASHTLVTGWSDPANLVPAIVASAPEPADAELFGVALASLGIIALSRSRRRVQST